MVTCSRCGAPVAPATDGRTYGCKYCGAVTQVALDPAQIAAGMRLDLANAGAFLERLGHVLEAVAIERARVERRGVEVVAIELDMSPDVFLARRETGRVIAQHKRIVRGIALKTTTHPLDRWVEMVSAALASHANENARVGAALASLLPHR